MKVPFIAKPKKVSRHAWRKFIRLSNQTRKSVRTSTLHGLHT